MRVPVPAGDSEAWGSHDPLCTTRVLEIDSDWAGSLCGRLLADAGADVVKLEADGPDSLRSVGRLAGDGNGYAFHVANAGKRSLAADPTRPGAGGWVAKLVGCSDVILEGDSVPAWLDEASIPPSVIRCAVTPYGRTGPLAGVAACDFTLQALLGLMDTTGFPAEPPTQIGIPVADVSAGLFAYIGIVAALYERAGSECGDTLDVAGFDCGASYLTNFLAQYLGTGLPPQRQGNRNPAVAPWNAYPTRDGTVVLCTTTDRQWRSILELADRMDLADDTRYQSTSARREHVEEVDEIVSEWTRRHTTADLFDQAEAHRLAVGRVRAVDELFDDHTFRQFGIREAVVANGDESRLVLGPVVAARGDARSGPDYSGNTLDVAMDWLGLDDDSAAALIDQQVLVGWAR